MLKFALKSMLVRRARLALVALSIVLSAGVALLAFNISRQVNDGIITTAGYYDLIIGPAGSSTQLAMNTMFFTDEPLGTISYDYVEELRAGGLTSAVVPFTMGDSYNGARIVGTEPAFLDGKPLKTGEMFGGVFEAVVGSAVAERYGLTVGDSMITSHGLTGTGHAHEATPLTVVGVLGKTGTAYDNVIFTSCETVWAVHDHGCEEHAHSDGEEHADDEHAHTDGEENSDDEHAHSDGEENSEAVTEAVSPEPAAVGAPSHAAYASSPAAGAATDDAPVPATDNVPVSPSDDTAISPSDDAPASATDDAPVSTSDSAPLSPSDDAADAHSGHSGEVCAILVRSRSFSDYAALTEIYGENASLLCINPSAVLREVLEQVDLSTQIVYVLCGIILLMNIVVISVITLLNMYDAQKEIALMRLIGVSMRRIGQLYLIQNGLIGLFAALLAMLLAHGCLALMGSFVASMGIVLNVTRIYPQEWAILALVFALSVLPTMLRILSMSRRDSLNG